MAGISIMGRRDTLRACIVHLKFRNFEIVLKFSLDVKPALYQFLSPYFHTTLGLSRTF